MKFYHIPLLCGGLLCMSFTCVACSDGITEVETYGITEVETTHSALYSDFIHDHDIYITTDPETGVQYIVYREKAYNAGMGGITPRLRPDGSLYVVDVEGG